MLIINPKKYFSGLTVIEVLVIITVMGLLVSAIMFTVSEVRDTSRDTVRLGHISQMQTALRAYHRDYGSYPAEITPGEQFAVGEQIYMEEVPTYPTPADGDCANDYEYDYVQLSAGESYEIYFCLGEPLGEIPAGESKAMPTGIININ